MKRSLLVRVGAMLLLAGCATTAPELPAPPLHANGGVLWRIISSQCLPGQLAGDPKPCAKVSTADGYVVLKDRDGVAQYLVMPSEKVTGIEDPKVLAAGAPNYFSQAWRARSYVAGRLSRPLTRDETSVAVNSMYGRSQDQLHLHVDCLAGGVRTVLARQAGRIGPRWSAQPLVLAGHPYRARWIAGEELAANPFRLLAGDMPGAGRQMGAWTLVLVGATNAAGAPGFILLADRADPVAKDAASGEELQDHSCGAGVPNRPDA